MGSTFPWMADFIDVSLICSSTTGEFQLIYYPKPLWDRCGDAIKRVIESYGWNMEEKIRLNEYGEPIKLVPLVGHAKIQSNIKIKEE